MTAVTVSKKDAGKEIQTKILVDWADQINGTAWKNFDAARMAAGFAQAASKEPKLLEATPTSLFLALSNIARWGLDIGEGAHLVAISGRAEAWPDYRGLKALAMRQGLIRHMEEYVVYEGDEFEYAFGLSPYLKHRPCSETLRGPLVGAYTVIEIRGLHPKFHFMPIADIERIRAKSRSWGPKQIRDCPPWYAKKTVVRDWLNRQPKVGALAEALAHDDVPEGEAVDVATGELLTPTPEHKQLVAASMQEAPAALEDSDEDLALDAVLAGDA